jgi:ABC-type antimicrobial peptide transport system permease subunit
MALGASAAQLRGLILWQVAHMTLIGGTLGLFAAFGLGWAAQSLLFGLDGHDPLVVTVSVALLTLVAFCAGLLPAVRASRINPLRALRWH